MADVGDKKVGAREMLLQNRVTVTDDISNRGLSEAGREGYDGLIGLVYLETELIVFHQSFRV